MTTIAANLTEMAGDTFLSDGHRTEKIFRITKVGIVGFAGDAFYGRALVKWVSEGERGPAPMWDEAKIEDTTLMILDSRGLWTMNGRGIRLLCTHAWAAIGAGADYAVGAMAAGASPLKAVEIASMYEPNTKPPFSSFTFRRRR